MPVLLNENEPATRQHNIQVARVRWFFVFFVISGFCGLVYEIVWLRLAMASFGVGTGVVSIFISMFMAGLGLGSWGGGALMRRVPAIGRALVLRLYSAAESFVAVSSLLVPYELRLGRLLLTHLGSFGAWQTSRYHLFTGFWLALTLIPSCTCMGTTIPLLMRAIREPDESASRRSFSYLYTANVLGALIGTLSSAFVLIELFGFKGTLYVAGILNITLAVSAFAASSYFTPSASIRDPLPVKPKEPRLYGLSRSVVLSMLFASGVVSMGMEVVWIRQLTPYLGNVVYTFAGILATYLLATFIGSQDYRSWSYYHNSEESASAWIWLAVFSVIPLIAFDPLIPLRVGEMELGGLRLSSIVLFCALSGFLTPLLVDAWSSGDPARAGTAYAINVAGSILGPLVAGFGLLPWLGERWAMMALSMPLFAIAAMIALRKPASELAPRDSGLNRKLKFILAATIALLLFRFSHDYEKKYPIREVRRDYTATVVAYGTGFDRDLLVNGFGMTRLTPITKYMAHLPLAFRSTNKPAGNGLVICFGMGTTFRSMLSWRIRTTAVDLVPSVPALFGYFHADAKNLTTSPLARIVIDDGRRFLDGSTETYDVIVLDPPPPPAAPGSSLLYSVEFYEVVKRHLRPGGILGTWYPSTDADAITTASIATALTQSFPYVRAFASYNGYGIHFLAAREPLSLASASTLAARLPPAAVTDFVEWGPQATAQKQFEQILRLELPLDRMIAAGAGVVALRDDEPINEYYVLRDWFHLKR